MKPPGISMGMVGGVPVYHVTPSDRVSDQVYDTVKEAILAGWDPTRFINEARACWELALDEEKKRQMEEWNRK